MLLHVYLREDAITPTLERWLSTLFTPSRRNTLTDQLHTAQDTGTDTRTAAEQARRAIAAADRKLARHRAALEALDDHTDPALIATWIAQTQSERAAAQARLRQGTARTHLSRDAIAGPLAGITDHLTAYGHIGLKLTYHPARHTVRAEAQPRPHLSEIGSCPRAVSTTTPTPCTSDDA